MASTREIQSRIKSVRDTMKITSAMYMISSTKLSRARAALEETEPYFYTLQGTLARIIRHLPEIRDRYIADAPHASARSEGQGQPALKKRCYLVVTADKGLAGAYNHNVLKLAEEQLASEAPTRKNAEFAVTAEAPARENAESAVTAEAPAREDAGPAAAAGHRLLVVGEVGRQYFHSRGIPVEEHFLYTAQNPSMHRARVIGARVMEMYDSGQADEVHMIFTSMKNGLRTETNMVQLLPIIKQDFPGGNAPVDVRQEQFFYWPSPEEVIHSVVPNYIAGYIFGALVESYCSEHNARMVAMKAANDSAQEMLHSLSIEYNRVRQAAITQEITEVISGAKAQRKKKSRGR